MRISIALCTFNGANYLSDQLLSISQQTRLPDELIICDDVSTDNTLEIIESFAKSAPFKVQFHQNSHNLGSTRNFEQAIRLCEGDIIALSDQDDFWYPDKLETIETIFNTHPAVGLAFSNADVVDAHRNPLGYTLWESVRFDTKRQEQLAVEAPSVLIRRTVVTGAAMAFRTQFRDLVLPISPICVHDEWITFLIAVVSKLYMIEKPLLQYRQHGANQIGAEKVRRFERFRRIFTINSQIFLGRYEKYRALHSHVSERLPQNTSTLSMIDDISEYLYTRGTLPSHHLKRISPVLQLLAKGSYQRYSSTWLNFLRDILVRHRGLIVE